MAYARGVGVDTTAFEVPPSEWVDVASIDNVSADQALHVDAGSVAVLLIRDRGDIVAIADRCTHRGAPLHTGAIQNGCVTCPWHGSQFRLSDGQVARGPATRPQPTLDVRIVGNRVHVRAAKNEPGTLRQNPATPDLNHTEAEEVNRS
ncbi:Rieske (2Fe-2S) protein [Arthrobacter sp. AET 35A]|uniref:Rieske (2Fe-2S) protein n=1 Tax=Arthrobacter sp. AET 35A TaxID=2292643 RepID=UPI001CE2BCE3